MSILTPAQNKLLLALGDRALSMIASGQIAGLEEAMAFTASETDNRKAATYDALVSWEYIVLEDQTVRLTKGGAITLAQHYLKDAKSLTLRIYQAKDKWKALKQTLVDTVPVKESNWI